jgi:glycosyltransferase involved in cell wall biosynthesis
MRLLHLYRPRLPGLRAQAIQVVHTCHALAALGFEVTLLADSAGHGSPEEALALLGLEPHPGLDLRICPTAHPPRAGLWFRAALTRWWMGPVGIVLARDKARLVQATRILPRRHRIVLETHELDSLLIAEQGEEPDKAEALERQALSVADALVANCGGTLQAWHDTHGPHMPQLAAAVHNATHPDRQRPHRPPEQAVLRYVGSVRATKGLLCLLEQAGSLPIPLEIIGASSQELSQIPQGVLARPPVPYSKVPELLASASALLLPLQDNIFGRQLSSPLKLWDYLATSTPIVAADVPTVREILQMTGAEAHLYPPTQPESLGGVIQAALDAPPRLPHLRSWADRAAELEPILRGQS